MSVRAGTWLLALSAVLLAGCSSEESPASLPPLPSLSPSAAAGVATPPGAAMNGDAGGASAFAGYYLGLLNEAFRTGDATAVRAVTDSQCEGCENLIRSIAASRFVQGGDYTVLDTATPAVVAGDALVDIAYSRTESQTLDASGSVLSTAPAVVRQDAQMRLLRDGNSWRVLGFRLVEP